MLIKLLDWTQNIMCKIGIHDWHGEVIDGMLFRKCYNCRCVKPWDTSDG